MTLVLIITNDKTERGCLKPQEKTQALGYELSAQTEVTEVVF